LRNGNVPVDSLTSSGTVTIVNVRICGVYCGADEACGCPPQATRSHSIPIRNVQKIPCLFTPFSLLGMRSCLLSSPFSLYDVRLTRFWGDSNVEVELLEFIKRDEKERKIY